MKETPFALKLTLPFIAYSVFFSLLWSFQSRAENIFLPMIAGPRILKITNSSKEIQPLWLLIKGQAFFKELIYRVPAQGELHLNEADFLPTGLEYAIKTASPHVSVSRQVDDGSWIDGSALTSPQVTYDLPGRLPGSQAPAVKLVLQNQNYLPQTFVVRFRDRGFKTITEETANSLGFFQTSTHHLNPPTGTTYIEILGKGRLHSRLWIGKTVSQNGIASPGGWQKGRNFLPIEVPTPTTQTYFLLSNQSRSDSFVVALSDEGLIRRAKEILAGDRVFILFGQIEASEKSWNRPFHGTDRSPWSWTVSKVTNFAELGSIVCDSTPALVEESLPVWLRQQDICFWGFHLMRELSLDEVRWGISKDINDLAP